MNKSLLILFVTAVIALGYLYYLNNKKVNIIDVHKNDFGTVIIVDHFPISDKEKIRWWLENKNIIKSRYNINPSNEEGTMNYAFFLFGDGYQEEGKADRLCFNNIPAPKNCIDKTLLMSTMRTRKGGVQFIFQDAVYIQTKEGKIYKSDE